jgi:hypothetical protein
MSVMAAPFPGARPAPAAGAAGCCSVLLAPLGQLSGDGQLRELMEERRACQGGTGPIWYLPPAQVAALGLGHGEGEEAVATPSSAVLTWLQLRFGGRTREAAIPLEWLEAVARALPPGARLAALA